ncbi:glutaredoxin-1 [Phaenicophaeus curvirostris]|uniref:glutaredoxin-1 n=1 Tax=Phaenicophaeus curvirostris TaxID=33595 RepID=UPI0037F0DFA1
MADWFVNSRIGENKVTVFVKEGCPYSRNVMDILMEYNFAPGALERVDITRRQDIQDYFHQRVPCVYIGRHCLGGLCELRNLCWRLPTILQQIGALQ